MRRLKAEIRNNLTQDGTDDDKMHFIQYVKEVIEKVVNNDLKLYGWDG